MSANDSIDNSIDQRIITAALKLFAYEGYHAVSVPRIANEAEVGVGSIYRVTESKVTLARRVFDFAIAKLNEAVSIQAASGDTITKETFFWLHWSQFVGWIQTSPEYLRFVVLYVFVGPGQSHTRLEDIDLLRSLLEIAKQKDWLFTDDFNLLSNIIIGPLALLVLNSPKDQVPDEKVLNSAGEAILRALSRD